jgi:methyl-accepting chemotaxis protein PixJ
LQHVQAQTEPATSNTTPASPKKPGKLRFNLVLKTLLSAVTLGVFPLSGLAIAGYAWTNYVVTTDLRQQQQASAAQLAERFQQFLWEQVQDIQQLAALDILQDKRLNTTDKLKLLEQQTADSSSFAQLAILDRRGQLVLQTRSAPFNNQQQQDYFQQVLQTQTAVIAPITTADGKTTIVIAVPQQQPKQPVQGVLIAQLRPEAVRQFLLTANRDLGQSYITDPQGQVLFAIDQTSLNQPLNTAVPGLPLLQVTEQSAGSAVSQWLQWGLPKIDRQPQSLPDYLVGWSNRPSSSTLSALPWQTVVAANIPTVRQRQQSRASQFGLALLIALGVTGLVGLLVLRRTQRLVKDQVNQLETQYESLKVKQQRSIERSQWLGQMIETMRQSMGDAALLNTTVTELRYALQADRVMFYRCNDDWSGTIIAESVGPKYRQCLGQTIPDLFRKGEHARHQDNQIQVIPDIARLELAQPQHESFAKLQIKASLIAPILQHDQLIGWLCAHQCSHPRQWETEDVDSFAKLASQLGFVLGQSALLQSQAKRVEKSRILNEIVDSMRRSFQEEDILNTTVNELRYTLDADRVVVCRLERDASAVIQAESVGLSFRKLCGQALPQSLPDGVMARLRMGQVWWVRDVDTEGLPADFRAMLDEFQVRSSIMAPVLQNGDLVGLLAVHTCNELRSWEKEDIGLVAQLGHQLSLALHQASILRRQTLSAERLRTLNQLVSVMRRSLNETDILQTAAQELRLILDVDRVLVYRFEQPQQQLLSDDPLNHDGVSHPANAAAGPSHAGQVIAEAAALSVERLSEPAIQSLFAEIPRHRLQHGHVQSISNIDTAQVSPAHRELLNDLQIRASIVAPILQNGTLTGLLCAYNHTIRIWETQDLELFTKLAIQLGYALDQAALIAATEQDRAAARAAADATVTAQQQHQHQFEQRTQELLQQITPLMDGDLTIAARESNDPIGTIAKFYNTAIAALHDTIAQVQLTVSNVVRAASDNEDTISSLSLESHQKIQTVAHTIEQVQQIIQVIQHIAQQAEAAAAHTQLATQKLQTEDALLDRTAMSLSSMGETVAETVKKVKRLGEVSQRVARVVNLINGLATQTNLLAMNASIEATKAGEDNQGFVIVAEEVRALAQQSATATAEIGQVVEDIQRQTNELATAMQRSSEQVLNGTQLVEESRRQLDEISAVGLQLNQIVSDITQVTTQQTAKSDAVKQTIRKMATIANSTAQQTQTVAASFAQLRKLVADLQTSAAHFKVRQTPQ